VGVSARVEAVAAAMQAAVKDSDPLPKGRERLDFAAKLLVVGADALAAFDQAERPSEPEAERRSARLQLLWPPSLKDAAEQYAAGRRMSLNELTIQAVRLALGSDR
jgi:hypothetical protein